MVSHTLPYLSIDIMKKKTIEQKLANGYKAKTLEKAVKDVDLEKRTVTGMFNSYFYIDSDLDMLLPGAAAKSIQERGVGSTKGNRIKHLKDHDWSKNIARLDVLEERTVEINGRELEGIYHESFYPESTDSTDQLIKVQAGLYDARSIGFEYMNIELVEQGSDDYEKYLAMAINPEVAEEAGFFWAVKEIRLWEGSDVSFGANELTPTLGMKSISKDLLQRQLFDKLDACKGLMKTGKLSDEGFHQLDMEIKQIKSYISTFAEVQSFKKDAGKPASRQPDNTEKPNGKEFLKSLLTN